MDTFAAISACIHRNFIQRAVPFKFIDTKLVFTFHLNHQHHYTLAQKQMQPLLVI